MRSILSNMWQEAKKHAKSGVLPYFFGIMALLFAFNYTYDFEDSTIDNIDHGLLRWVAMWLWHALPYLTVCGLLYAKNLQRSWFAHPHFWVYVAIGFGLLALDRSFNSRQLFGSLMPTNAIESYFLSKVLNQWMGMLLVVLPMLAFAYMFRTHHKGCNAFGMSGMHLPWRIYGSLLLVAAVLVAIAANVGEMTTFYPRYGRSGGAAFAEAQGWHLSQSVLAYELSYAVGFISTEYFFRGFLVLGMMRFLGRDALLPMAAAYAMLHFGKPALEAFSSIFGGYVLGILALEHRSIWGGVLLHVGLAWMMELAGWLAG